MIKSLIFFTILLPVASLAQISITGRIINKADSKPVADASVFLANATIGNKTSANGRFVLHDVKPGKYELIVSVVGFETYSQSLMIENNDVDLERVYLTPKVTILNEIKVRPTADRNLQRNLKWFKEQFIGTAWPAADCKLLNPEILDFDYNDTTKLFTASAGDLLNLENTATGYRIKYLLTDFIKDYSSVTAQKTSYKGFALFKKLSGTITQEKRWQRRRLILYNGSMMQFLRCALNNTYTSAGFRVLQIKNTINPARPPDTLITAKIKMYYAMLGKDKKYTDSLRYWQTKAEMPQYYRTVDRTPLKQSDFIKLTDKKGIYALTGNGNSLLIQYNKANTFDDSDQFYEEMSKTGERKTIINFVGPYALFDRNGVVADPSSISVTGDWGTDRLAQLLPNDYSPIEDIQAPSAPGGGNGSSFVNSLAAVRSKLDSVQTKFAPEKLYLQFDKPYYAVNDTIWFKGYLLSASYLTASGKSGLLHIDIANDSNKVIKQYLLPVQSGMTWGNIVLDDRTYKTGSYILRAYTNWMRNFGEDGFFYKPFYISGTGESNLLVNAQFKSDLVNGNYTVNSRLIFGGIDQQPFAIEPMQLQVMAGSRQLYKQKLQTGLDGTLNVNFKIPLKTSGLAIIAESEKKDKRVVIPVILNRPENTDLQFLPEGGSLVAGIGTRVGFKAISEDGKGADISGVITDQDDKQIASFQSLHNGMGSFDLLPQPEKIYTAKVKLPDGSIKAYPLPAVKPSGTILQVTNRMESDSVTISFSATSDLMQSGYFLIGKARGVVCYAAVVNFKNSSRVTRAIAKSLFPTGITHFIVTTPDGRPVNERLVFIDHHDNLRLDLEPDQHVYEPRDSVAVYLRVRDQTGKPVSGNFAMAVTDDAQVKNDTINGENIITRLLLTSDLKGYVEAPGYYLEPQNATALDNLLLTQGWVSYEPINSNPQFEAEKAFVVKGNVKNVFGKPIKGTRVMLFSKSPVILMDTLTDQQGRFIFNQFPRVDTPIFILKAVNKNGKSFNVSLNVDETSPPIFNAPKMPVTAPWYVNSDTTLLNFTHTNARAKELQYTPQGGHVLKEVKIISKKVVKGSQNLNGPGNADVVLDEKDLEAAGKKTFRQLLEQNIKGFTEVQHGTHIWYNIYHKPIFLIVNGVRIDNVYNQFDFKQYIEFFNAEDVKGIEVLSSDKYTASYMGTFFPGVSIDAFAFVEITTRSGNAIITNTPGVYLYKPLAISFPAQFYKPKYSLKDTAKHTSDLRSTIDWEPNIVTDKNGEATVTFYTADKPSTYTLITEGTDMNGNLGYKTARIIIRKTKDKAK